MALLEAVVEGEGLLGLALAQIEIGDDLDHPEGLLARRLHRLRVMLGRLIGTAGLVGQQAELQLIERLEPRDRPERRQGLLGRIHPAQLELGPGAQHGLHEALESLALDAIEIAVCRRVIARLCPVHGQRDPRSAVQRSGRVQALGEADGFAHASLAHHQVEARAQELDVLGIGRQGEAQKIGGGSKVSGDLSMPAGEVMAERRGVHLRQALHGRSRACSVRLGGHQHRAAEGERSGEAGQGGTREGSQGAKLR